MFGQTSSKPDFISSLGYKVLFPLLDDWNFLKSVQAAQFFFDEEKPDLIVGSSRGGAVAMNMDSKEIPLVLLAPAWPFFGDKQITKENSTIIHSENDILININYSEQLSKNSNCKLIIAGSDHRLNCKKGRELLKQAITSYM